MRHLVKTCTWARAAQADEGADDPEVDEPEQKDDEPDAAQDEPEDEEISRKSKKLSWTQRTMNMTW
eukprot:5990671-Amphidinium_carterae.1